MNRKNNEAAVYAARASLRNVFHRAYAKVAAGAALVVGGAQAAMAGPLGEAAAAAVGGVEADVNSVLLVLVVVLFLIVGWQYLKRAK